MIDIKRSFFGWTDTQELALGADISEEGQGLVAVLENGVEKVKPAEGVAAEKLVGFAVFRQLDFSTAAVVEDHIIPVAADYIVELSKNNLVTGQWRVEVTGAALGAFVVDETAGTITFAAADKGRTVRVYYRYELTVAQVKQTFYEAPINHPNPNFFAQVGVGKGKGRVFTMYYDQSIDWSDAAVVPGFGVDGLIADSVTLPCTAIPGGRVVHIPTPVDPYLGVEFLL